MTKLPASVTDRSRAVPANDAHTASNAPDVTAILHLARTVLTPAQALLLPLASLFAGLLALGLQVNAVLYGASVFLARTALVLIGIWLIVYAVRAGFHVITNAISQGAGGAGLSPKAGGTSSVASSEAPREVTRPRLALPADAPAPRYGETLDS